MALHVTISKPEIREDIHHLKQNARRPKCYIRHKGIMQFI
jgi:hypothetical protein